jgi:thiol-disulfide isomerase/thioredoxin
MLGSKAQLLCKPAGSLLILLLASSALAQQGSPPAGPQGVSRGTLQDGFPADAPVIRFARNPDAAPPFTVKDLDGKPLSLETSRGKVTLINFWATWCPPCRAEIPDLTELQGRYAGKLQILGLSVDEDTPANLKKFVAASGINFPVALVPPEVSELYGGVPALPTSFLLDTQGRVVQKHVGLHDANLYETEIRALLGLPIQARVETFEDTGEIFLRHADRATRLPGVDLSGLNPEQKKAALRRFNAESCACPCKLTLAQCRVNDSGCPVSKAMTERIVSEISSALPPAKSAASPSGKP